MQNNILPTTPVNERRTASALTNDADAMRLSSSVKEKKQRKPRSKPIIDIIKIEEDASVKSDDDIIIDENANMEIINLVKEKEAQPDELGIEPIIFIKKKTYTEAQKRAILKYREANPEKIAEITKKSYEKKMADPEKKKQHYKNCVEANRKKRQIEKQKIEADGGEVKSVGRPKLILNEEVYKQKKKEWNAKYRGKQKDKECTDTEVKPEPKKRGRKKKSELILSNIVLDN